MQGELNSRPHRVASHCALCLSVCPSPSLQNYDVEITRCAHIGNVSQTPFQLFRDKRMRIYIYNSKVSRSEMAVSENVEKLLGLLAELDKIVDETPPISQPARFGNAAYRQWYQKFSDHKVEAIKGILPENLRSRAPELAAYYGDSFGE